MLSIKANNNILCIRCSIGISEIYLGWKWRGNPLPSGFTVGCRAACSLQTLILIFAGIAQWQTHWPTNKQKHDGMQTHRHALPSFLRKEKNADTWSFEAYPPKAQVYSLYKSCPNLTPQMCRHTLQGSFLTVPTYSHCSRKTTFFCPNQIKMCIAMTPSAVRKTSRIWSRLLEFNLM